MAVVATVVAVLLLASCGASGAAPAGEAERSGRTVTGAFGAVTVPAEINSVVILEGRRDLDIALSLGLPVTGYPALDANQWDLTGPLGKDLEAARSQGAKELFARGQVNLEAIAGTAPDLIIGRFSDIEPIRAELEAIAAVLPVGDQDTSRWQDDLRLVASATGREQRATELLNGYDERVAALKERYAGVLAERTFAPMNYDLEDDATDSRAQRLLSTVMTDVGMRPSRAFATAIDGQKAEFGPEQLLTGYGDANGLVAVVTEPEAWQQLQQRPLYQQLAAVREGHVVRADRRTHEGAALTAGYTLGLLEQLLQTF
ncbi:hypothetical protein CGZ96_14585 [Enemella evansiae]|nr:hypothetical protein CGZ96_14585 [Enemella evansiae]